MDDFDDLLDEVEKEISISKKPLPKAISKRTTALDDDVDAILNDSPAPIRATFTTKSKPVSVVKKSSGSTKCSSLFLGGAKTPSGLCSLTSRKSCDRLRCTSCDFKVEQFNDYEWSSDVDYLFLRNNMPDFHKLQRRLRKAPGSRAYACQCSWKSAKELTGVVNFDLKWVCGRH